ncbi:MAG: primosomal protein N' [Lentisphaeraceae bacterium]|nr:primosomal protein N' [Lentisphaeraceae bacterium]
MTSIVTPVVIRGDEKIAAILPDISLDKEFEYLIPAHLKDSLKVGCRVNIPFGRRELKGYVVEIKDEPDFDRRKLKPVNGIEGHFIPEKLMELGSWIAEYYCARRIHTIRSMLPAPVRSDKVTAKKITVYKIAKGVEVDKLIEEYEQKKQKQSRASVLRTLNAHQEGTSKFICDTAGVSSSPIKSLEADGIIKSEVIQVDRDPFANEKIVPSQPLKLTAEQAESMKMILKSMDTGERQVVLIQGVTGCGKTELYLQAIQHCLDKGQQAIVLVPEISLTPQTNQRFRARFGERVSVLHSRLGDGERYDQWMRIHHGKTDIVVGARSALFAPFKNLGLIVVDEEHEASYKQDKAPRYHARDVAVMRAHLEKCTVLLGSATPSFESLSNAKKGKYHLSVLKKRVATAVMPKMEMVDMRNESNPMGGAQVFSKALIRAVKTQLYENMQTILFLNRRGYATQMQCLKCGFVAKCDDCSCTYTYHQKMDTLSCRYCGGVHRAPRSCPECGDKEIKFSGLGTEKIERMCQGIFPGARITRMDSDTMTRKDSHKNTLAAFQAGEYDILIGTQMIAKGLHFPRVTLVGIIFADLGLHQPDFRASERTFQLLTQVAGRAGRGAVAGKVLVQSYTPFHPALQYAMKNDVDQFYGEEIIGRELMSFPPHRSVIIVHFRGANETLVQKTAEHFHEQANGFLDDTTMMMPVVPSSITKIKTLYRYQILFVTGKIVRLAKLLRHMTLDMTYPKGVEVYADVDPQSLS